MAENKTINIKINQNADKAEKSFKSYNKELGNTKKQYDAVLKSGKPFDQQLEDINKIVKETPLNVRDMNKQIQAYQSIALSAGRETPVGKQALEQAAQLRDRYIDIQNETKRLADDQRNLEGAIQGISTGVAIYGGVQSAMALSGVESEKLRETLVKLQAAQTLMNSINQVATAFEKESALMLTLKSAKTKALTVATAAYSAVTGTTTGVLKAFRIALASTGIGALVAGIGLLIANFDKVLKLFSPIIDGLKSMGDAIGLTNFAEEEQNQERKRRAEEQRMRIEAERKQRDNAFKQRQGQFDREIALLEAEGKSTVELTKQKIESSIAYQKEKVKEIQLELEGLKVYEEAFKGQSAFEKMGRENARKLREEREAEILELNNNISDSENQLKINVINNNKKKAASYKSYAKEKENNARKIEDLENNLLQDGLEKELKINEVKFRRLREDAEKNTKLTRDERKKIIDLYDKKELAQQKVINQKYIDLEKKKNAKIDEEKAKANKERIDKEDALFQLELSLMKDRQMAEIIALTQQYDKKFALANGNAELERQLTEQQEADIAAIQDKYRKEKEAKEEKADKEKAERQQAQIDLAVQGLQLVAGFAELFAGDDEKRQKKAFQIKKAADIASATVDGYKAVLSTYAQTPGGPVLKGIAAGIAGGFASLQIANIARQQFEGGGGAGGDFSADTGAGEVQAPSFNVVGDAGINQLAQLQQQPLQAYVVSGEVTTGQALDRNRVQNATL